MSGNTREMVACTVRDRNELNKIIGTHGWMDSYRCAVCGKKVSLTSPKTVIIIGDNGYTWCQHKACPPRNRRHHQGAGDFLAVMAVTYVSFLIPAAICLWLFTILH
jgi:DNA-directed RNA polymerase subunit RPC12/RpoP